jgi:hypothetical protein
MLKKERIKKRQLIITKSVKIHFKRNGLKEPKKNLKSDKITLFIVKLGTWSLHKKRHFV